MRSSDLIFNNFSVILSDMSKVIYHCEYFDRTFHPEVIYSFLSGSQWCTTADPLSALLTVICGLSLTVFKAFLSSC